MRLKEKSTGVKAEEEAGKSPLYITEEEARLSCSLCGIDWPQQPTPTLHIQGHKIPLGPNAGGEFRRDSDVNSTALLADSGGDK